MSVSSEIIKQSVFTAALFLTLISVPKLIVLTVWYTYRIFFFRNLEKIAKGKSLQTIIKGKALQSLREMSEKPAIRVKQMAKEYGNFVKSLRDPIIEAVTALIIMVAVSSIFPEISTWLIASFFVIIITVVWVMGLVVLFARDVNRIVEISSADDTKKSSV